MKVEMTITVGRPATNRTLLSPTHRAAHLGVNLAELPAHPREQTSSFLNFFPTLASPASQSYFVKPAPHTTRMLLQLNDLTK